MHIMRRFEFFHFTYTTAAGWAVREGASDMCGRGVNLYPLNAGFVFPAGSRSALAGEAG